MAPSDVSGRESDVSEIRRLEEDRIPEDKDSARKSHDEISTRLASREFDYCQTRSGGVLDMPIAYYQWSKRFV